MSKKTKVEEKSKLFWIFNQEEVPVAVAYTKTASGALARFELETGYPRANYRATEMSFTRLCSLTGLK